MKLEEEEEAAAGRVFVLGLRLPYLIFMTKNIKTSFTSDIIFSAYYVLNVFLSSSSVERQESDVFMKRLANA